jgi:hypothetical protein
MFANEIVYAIELGRGQNVAGHSLFTAILTVENFVAYGAAALHPSMRDLTKAATDPMAKMTRRRLFLMTTAVLTPPVVLAVRSATGLENAAIIGCWGVISIMVMVRMAGLVRARERAQELDRVLTRAAAGLVAATETTDMFDTALSTAPSGCLHWCRPASSPRGPVRWQVASEKTPGAECPGLFEDCFTDPSSTRRSQLRSRARRRRRSPTPHLPARSPTCVATSRSCP